MNVTIGKIQTAALCAVLCTGFFFAPLCGQIESDTQEKEPVKQQVIPNQTDLEQAALEAYIKAFTPRFFSGHAELDDVRKLMEVLAMTPQSHDLCSFFFAVLDRTDENDRATLYPRIKEILAQNPENILLNLNAGEFFYSHNDKKLALHYAGIAFRLGLAGKSKDKMPEYLRLVASVKYPLFCMATAENDELAKSLELIRAVPELKDRAEIIALYSLVVAREVKKKPPLLLPFYQDPGLTALKQTAEQFLERCKTQESIYSNLDTVRLMPPLVSHAVSQEKEFAETFLTLAKKDPGCYLIVADIWLAAEQPLKAAAVQAELLRKQKQPSMQLLLRTTALFREHGRPEEALRLIREMEPKFRNREQLVMQKIMIYTQMEQPRRALVETLSLPEGFDRFVQQALLLYELKQYQEAYKQIQKAYAYSQEHKIALNVIRFSMIYAEIAERCSDMKGVKMILEPLIKVYPRNAELLNFLGYTLADHNTDLEQAAKYIETALKYMPDDAAILDSMAWVLYRQKKYEEAAKYMKKAIQVDKNISSEMWDHAGDIALAQGHKKDAVICWLNALKVSGDIDVTAVLKKIRENSGK